MSQILHHVHVHWAITSANLAAQFLVSDAVWADHLGEVRRGKVVHREVPPRVEAPRGDALQENRRGAQLLL